jgi:hypothetical protein
MTLRDELERDLTQAARRNPIALLFLTGQEEAIRQIDQSPTDAVVRMMMDVTNAHRAAIFRLAEAVDGLAAG